MHIENNIKYSAKLAFKQSQFYQQLPPKLRSLLVSEVLKKQILALRFFFNDYIRGVSAPQLFVEKVMISLQSSLYNVGDVIVDNGDKMDFCYFIVKGQCTLSGIHKQGENEYLRVPVVKLRDGGWYGDYQILLSVKSDWHLEATAAPKKKTKGYPDNAIQILKIDDETFLKICHQFPEFRKHLLQRAKIRRCHWKKVFEENRHYCLL